MFQIVLIVMGMEQKPDKKAPLEAGQEEDFIEVATRNEIERRMKVGDFCSLHALVVCYAVTCAGARTSSTHWEDEF